MFLYCKLGKTAPPNMTHLAHCCLEEVVLLSVLLVGALWTPCAPGTPYPWLGAGLRRKREPGSGRLHLLFVFTLHSLGSCLSCDRGTHAWREGEGEGGGRNEDHYTWICTTARWYHMWKAVAFTMSCKTLSPGMRLLGKRIRLEVSGTQFWESRPSAEPIMLQNLPWRQSRCVSWPGWLCSQPPHGSAPQSQNSRQESGPGPVWSRRRDHSWWRPLGMEEGVAIYE